MSEFAIEITADNEAEFMELVSTYGEDVGGVIGQIRYVLQERLNTQGHLSMLVAQLDKLDPEANPERWDRIMKQCCELEERLGL